MTSGSNGYIQGLAFILKDLSDAELQNILPYLEVTIPISDGGLDALKTLKKLIRENRNLKEISITDSLTGLYNVRYFRERLEVEMQRVNRTEKPCSLIMMDLDGFKSVNDTHGHQAGDDLLRHVADIIRGDVRVVDLPIRYGGDEMAVILPDTGVQAAFQLAKRLRYRIETDEVTKKYGVTGSFGLATHQHFDQEDATEMVERADQALYHSKNLGGNRVWFFESDHIKEKTTEVTVDERDDLFDFLRLG